VLCLLVLPACSANPANPSAATISCGVITQVYKSDLQLRYIPWAVGVRKGHQVALEPVSRNAEVLSLTGKTQFGVPGIVRKPSDRSTLKRAITRLPLDDTYLLKALAQTVEILRVSVPGGARQHGASGCPNMVDEEL